MSKARHVCRAPEHKIARLATVRVVLFYFQTKVSVAGHRQERLVAHLHCASRGCSLVSFETSGVRCNVLRRSTVADPTLAASSHRRIRVVARPQTGSSGLIHAGCSEHPTSFLFSGGRSRRL